MSAGSPLWTTADGRELTAAQMSVQHLSNTICLIERRVEGRARYLGIFAPRLSGVESTFLPAAKEEHKIRLVEGLAWDDDTDPNLYDAGLKARLKRARKKGLDARVDSYASLPRLYAFDEVSQFSSVPQRHEQPERGRPYTRVLYKYALPTSYVLFSIATWIDQDQLLHWPDALNHAVLNFTRGVVPDDVGFYSAAAATLREKKLSRYDTLWVYKLQRELHSACWFYLSPFYPKDSLERRSAEPLSHDARVLRVLFAAQVAERLGD